jgi:hypothetical protein
MVALGQKYTTVSETMQYLECQLHRRKCSTRAQIYYFLFHYTHRRSVTNESAKRLHTAVHTIHHPGQASYDA